MRKRPFAEWVLSHEAGAERASALLGDLEELAATRGRLWFWTMYLRAVVTMGWRGAVPAFLVAYFSIRSHWFNLLLISIQRHAFYWMPRAEPWFIHRPWLINYNNVIHGLVFLLPLVALFYGLRDRLTRLTFVLFLLYLPVYSDRTWPMAVSDVLVLAVSVLTFCLLSWRRPMVVLAGVMIAQFAAGDRAMIRLWQLLEDHHLLTGAFSQQQGYLFGQFLFGPGGIVCALVCFYLHRRFLRSDSQADYTPAAIH